MKMMIIIITIIQFFIYLFTCLLKNLKANYKASMSKDSNKTNTYRKQNARQGNLHHLDNSNLISAIIPTIKWRGKISKRIFI